MPDLINATPFGAMAIPSADRDGRDLLLIVVAAKFEIREPHAKEPSVRRAEEQTQVPLIDEYYDEPGQSSVRIGSQSVYTRPATDIHVWGEACAPEEESVHNMTASIQVGPCSIKLQIHGDRVWQRSVMHGAVPSSPKPFIRMPLIWERAYGGVAASSTEQKPVYEPRNPVGCGLDTDPSDAIDKPIPNIEDPGNLLKRLADRPTPIGVSPIGRDWQPRVSYAGTYDDKWVRQRAPLWPEDFDERFFCAAPIQLQAQPHLRGGELVSLEGLNPGGPLHFSLPKLKFKARSRFLDRIVRTEPILDAVLIETDPLQITMFYRATVPAPLNLVKHKETFIRLMEPWEMER